MAMNLILWIIFGALAGWIASKIMNTDAEQGAIANIVVGIVGAVIGGWIARAVIGTTVTGFNLTSLIIAIVGAIVLLAVLKALGFMGGGRGVTHTRV
jgi:uncharacterized membrane protein YeaQ/YmgE (transglycosylase-associated protein family)